jgi:hypothetical protein
MSGWTWWRTCPSCHTVWCSFFFFVYAVFNFLMIVWMSWCFFVNDGMNCGIGLPIAGTRAISLHVYSDSYVPCCPQNSRTSKQTAMFVISRVKKQLTAVECFVVVVCWLWSDKGNRLSGPYVWATSPPFLGVCVPSPLAYHVFAVAMTS